MEVSMSFDKLLELQRGSKVGRYLLRGTLWASTSLICVPQDLPISCDNINHDAINIK